MLRFRLQGPCLFQVTSLSRSQVVGRGAKRDGELFCVLGEMIRLFPALLLKFSEYLIY